jgi:hypothetical protein
MPVFFECGTIYNRFKYLPSNLNKGRKEINLYKLFNTSFYDSINRLPVIILIRLKDDHVEWLNQVC